MGSSKIVEFRNFKYHCNESFLDDIRSLNFSSSDKYHNSNKLWLLWKNDYLMQIVEKHEPLQKREVSKRRTLG